MHHEEWNSAPTMLSPAPGFTGRVMARIAEREQAAARRRAVLGIGLLVAVAVVLLALVGALLLLVALAVVDMPDALVSGWAALAPVFDLGGTVAQALWAGAVAFADNVSMGPMLLYAMLVGAMTLVWVRVVNGSTQLASQSIFTGEQK